MNAMSEQQRRWDPEMGGSPMPPTSAERYEQIARDLNLCNCQWCEGHPPGDDVEPVTNRPARGACGTGGLT